MYAAGLLSSAVLSTYTPALSGEAADVYPEIMAWSPVRRGLGFPGGIAAGLFTDGMVSSAAEVKGGYGEGKETAETKTQKKEDRGGHTPRCQRR